MHYIVATQGLKMNQIFLDLLNRDHGRAFANDRSHKLGGRHPLDDVSKISLVFREEDYDLERKEQVIVGLALEGDVPAGLGAPLARRENGTRFEVSAGLLVRESPVPYRMRILGIEVAHEVGDALQRALEKNRLEQSMFIGTLVNIFAGRSEIDRPPMTYCWESTETRLGRAAMFLFLHVNFQDNPGLARKTMSAWRRPDDAFGIHQRIRTMQMGHTSFPDLWPLFDPKI